jgi:2-iminoacetate synthase
LQCKGQIFGAIYDILTFIYAKSRYALSTRENAKFRNHAIQLGITKMSAGVHTAVGGHIKSQENSGQFAVSDDS